MNRLQFVLTLLSVRICTNSAVPSPDVIDVRNLMGEPDYRKVTLHWEAYTRSGRALPHFQVRYCELQSWGTQRCRTHDVSEPSTNELFPDNSKTYSANVDGLRMATTYSFQVRPALAVAGREDRSDNTIVIPTKGFSARATQCLPHASEIEVSTGPHFGGRITVEAGDGDRCTVDGEPNSSRDTYVLHIDHKVCGSQVNETTVATYVIVQENLPILTHSTRRFLVLCSYQPETLTVRAGLSLPNARGHGHGQAAAVPTINDQPNSNYVRRSRQLRPARLESANTSSSQNKQKEPASTAIIISVLTLFAVCCIAVVSVSRLRTKRTTLPADTISVSSDISVSTDVSENITTSEEHSEPSTHTEPGTRSVETRC